MELSYACNPFLLLSASIYVEARLLSNGHSKSYSHYLLLSSTQCVKADVYHSRHPYDRVWSRRNSQGDQECSMYMASSPPAASAGMYGTNRCYDCYRVEQTPSKHKGQSPTGLIAVSFDQRNHGTRKVDNLANEAWRSGNESHAQDMFSIYREYQHHGESNSY